MTIGVFPVEFVTNWEDTVNYRYGHENPFKITIQHVQLFYFNWKVLLYKDYIYQKMPLVLSQYKIHLKYLT